MRLRNSRNCKQSAKLFSPYLTAADDGYSGTNFDRPDWKRLTADIEEGKIGCVIVKDMSRIGRNYLEVGFYTEVLFSTMGFPENWKELLQHK